MSISCKERLNLTKTAVTACMRLLHNVWCKVHHKRAELKSNNCFSETRNLTELKFTEILELCANLMMLTGTVGHNQPIGFQEALRENMDLLFSKLQLS